MSNDQFIVDVQKFTTVAAIGGSVLRRQGTGTIVGIQRMLGAMDLAETMDLLTSDQFSDWLDQKTDQLITTIGAKWGAARKALNLFLRDCLYNKYLSAHFELDHLEPWLEIPLDRVIGVQLKRDAGRGRLPTWPGLRKLTKEESIRFQEHANHMAGQKGLARVHLDVGMWVNNR